MEPNTPSAKVKDTPKYSANWRPVNEIAKYNVPNNPLLAQDINPYTKAWCVTVTDDPDDNNIVVFAAGTSEASIGSNALGGHSDPISIAGANDEWKYAQRIERKKKTSLIINNATPKDNPFCTLSVCAPKYVASVIISLNQRPIPQHNNINENITPVSPIGKPWNHNTAEIVSDNNTADKAIGHGDWSTIWYGCRGNGTTFWNVFTWDELLKCEFKFFKLILVSFSISFFYNLIIGFFLYCFALRVRLYFYNMIIF